MCNLHIMSDEIDALLAPLARLAVELEIRFPDLAERLKGHLVDAATELAEGKPTDSRVSLMTGLQRRDVARLKAFEAKPPKPTPLTRLVSLWRTDPRYLKDGVARRLPRLGDAPSFESLAREVLQDVHPRTLLDSLLASGTVRLEGDSVELVADAYLPKGGGPDQLAYLAANVGDHLRAATENVFDDKAHFERALHVAGLTEEQIGTLLQRFEDGQMALLERLQKNALQMKNDAGDQGDCRIRIGAYAYATKLRSAP